MFVLIAAVLLIGAVVVFIVQPLLTGEAAPLARSLDEPTEAEARRRVTLLALRDVEQDYLAGKLGADDYRDLRRELSAEALHALDAFEREAETAGRDPGREAPSAACDRCGVRNRPDSRFCAACGAALAAAR